MAGMYRNIFSVGGWTVVSRLTGFFRDMGLAALLGGGALNDAYVAAIKLPNQFRQIFGEGSFNAAYLPTYTSVLEQKGPEEAGRFASQIFTLLILSQIVLLGLVYLDMPLLVRLTSPGFVDEPAKFAAAVSMSRVMFPYITFIALFALHQGTLNANNSWSVPAAAPAAANVCMIGFLAFAGLFPKLSPGVAAMASWGFLASGATQLVLVMIDARRRGLLERLTWPGWTPEVRRFFIMLGPAIGISASYQIGALADQIVGSLLPTGGLSAISYADRLYQLPGGVIVIATGSVLLREMSMLVARGDETAALGAQNRAASLTIALGAPFVVVFLMIPDLIISAAFEHGAFKADATRQAAAVLAAYSVGMPALFVDRIVAASFLSRGDTATPMKVTLVGVALNVALKIALYRPLGAPGLALATAAGLWVKVIGVFALAYRRGWTAPDARLVATVAATLFASGALALTLAFADGALIHALAGIRFSREIRLLLLAAIGALVYFGALGGGLGVAGAAPKALAARALRPFRRRFVGRGSWAARSLDRLGKRDGAGTGLRAAQSRSRDAAPSLIFRFSPTGRWPMLLSSYDMNNADISGENAARPGRDARATAGLRRRRADPCVRIFGAKG